MKRIAIILSATILTLTACDKSAIFSDKGGNDETAFMDEVANDDAQLELKETDFDQTILVALEKPKIMTITPRG